MIYMLAYTLHKTVGELEREMPCSEFDEWLEWFKIARQRKWIE